MSRVSIVPSTSSMFWGPALRLVLIFVFQGSQYSTEPHVYCQEKEIRKLFERLSSNMPILKRKTSKASDVDLLNAVSMSPATTTCARSYFLSATDSQRVVHRPSFSHVFSVSTRRPYSASIHKSEQRPERWGMRAVFHYCDYSQRTESHMDS